MGFQDTRHRQRYALLCGSLLCVLLACQKSIAAEFMCTDTLSAIGIFSVCHVDCAEGFE